MRFSLCSSNFITVEKFGDSGGRISVANKLKCRDMAHFDKHYQDILDAGGEGIILRNPAAFYEPGRSPNYLKYKVTLYPSFFSF